MNIREKIILLSPHLDDIAFSIAGLIHTLILKQNTIYLINIFSRSVYCRPGYKTNCVNKQRVIEDKNFIKQFNLNSLDLNLDDSSVLKHTELSEIICAPSDLRRKEVKRLLVEIFNKIKPSTVFCPLAIGGHIDHKMVKEIFLSINYGSIQNIFFYEDLPYAGSYTPEEISIIINKMNTQLSPLNIEITDVWPIKEQSISFYESQVNQSTIVTIKNYAKSLGNDGKLYERIWIAN